MKQTLLHEKYPIFTLKIDKKETRFCDIDAIIGFLENRIKEHKLATLIAIFDHLAHTKSLPDGHHNLDIKAAQNIVFCFGLTIPDPQVLAVRPWSIGVAETYDAFFVTFMEAPMPVANSAMESWAKGLLDLTPMAKVPKKKVKRFGTRYI